MRGQQQQSAGTETRQRTLRTSVSLDGVGVHADVPARLTLHPADAGTGILFLRTHLPKDRERLVPAHIRNAVSSELATRLALPAAPRESVSTVEHVLAALNALGIDNAILEIDGPEVPILDGTAAPFVRAIDAAGVMTQNAARQWIEVLKPIRVALGDTAAEFLPFAGTRLDLRIDFAHPAVGTQTRSLVLSEATFRHQLARARTFGFVADAERLWRAGLALGSSLENTVVIADGGVINAGGFRYPDECVRHKMLDAVGDLALAGAPVRGLFRSVRGGHALNRLAVAALLADRSAWRLSEAAHRPLIKPTRDVSTLDNARA